MRLGEAAREHAEVRSFLDFFLGVDPACARPRAGSERTGARGDAGLSRQLSPAPPRLRADGPRPRQASRRTGLSGPLREAALGGRGKGGEACGAGARGEGPREAELRRGAGAQGTAMRTGARPRREVSKVSQGLGVGPENTRGTFEGGDVWEKSLRPQKGWEGPRGSRETVERVQVTKCKGALVGGGRTELGARSPRGPGDGMERGDSRLEAERGGGADRQPHLGGLERAGQGVGAGAITGWMLWERGSGLELRCSHLSLLPPTLPPAPPSPPGAGEKA